MTSCETVPRPSADDLLLIHTDTFASKKFASLVLRQSNRKFFIFFYRHILGNVGRVVGRDASRATAQVQDLYVALCEDETVYNLFKTMKGGCCTVSEPLLPRADRSFLQSKNRSNAKAKASRPAHGEVNRFLEVETCPPRVPLRHNLGT